MAFFFARYSFILYMNVVFFNQVDCKCSCERYVSQGCTVEHTTKAVTGRDFSQVCYCTCVLPDINCFFYSPSSHSEIRPVDERVSI